MRTMRWHSKAMPTAPASSMSSTSTVPRVRATWPSTMPASATCVWATWTTRPPTWQNTNRPKAIPAEIVNAQNIGLQGDIAVEKGDYAAAIKLFEKAAKVSDNNLTAPMYLRKAALAANAMGNKEQALGFAQRIQNEFPASAEAQNAEKLMGTIQQ